MTAWMHKINFNLLAKMKEMWGEEELRGSPAGNNSPIAAPFAGECQVATSQVQLICLPPTLGASLLLMWKYDDDATLNDFAIPSAMRGRNSSV